MVTFNRDFGTAVIRVFGTRLTYLQRCQQAAGISCRLEDLSGVLEDYLPRRFEPVVPHRFQLTDWSHFGLGPKSVD